MRRSRSSRRRSRRDPWARLRPGPLLSQRVFNIRMKIVATQKAAEFIRERGGRVWVWLDPRRGLVGSYIWLEAHTEPPGTSRRSSFTRSSKRPHRFKALDAGEIEVNYAFARFDPPEE